MKKKSTTNKSRTDFARLDQMNDKDIDQAARQIGVYEKVHTGIAKLILLTWLKRAA